MRTLLRIVGGILLVLAVGAAVVAGLFVFALKSMFEGWAPGPTPWSDPGEVPRAFAGAVPAGLALETPGCPEGGLRPVVRPTPVGDLVGVVLFPWYGVPALFNRDELLFKPTGSLDVRVVDPLDGKPVEKAQIAAIRADDGRFVQQFEGRRLGGLPVGRYVLRAATSTDPVRWGEATAEVVEGASGSAEIRLDRVAPEIAPRPPAAAPPAAARVRLEWDGRTGADGLAVVARVGSKGDRAKYTRVKASDGVATVQVTAAPGRHVASYLLCAPLVRTARWLIDVGPSDTTVALPPRIRGGDRVRLPVSGSFASPAQFGIRETGGDRQVVESGFVSAGETIGFVAPLAGGSYELTVDGDDAALFRAEFTVDPVAVSVLAPARAAFRQPVSLGWSSEVPAPLRLEIRPYVRAGWAGFRPTDRIGEPGPKTARWKLPPGRSQLRLVVAGQSDLAVATAVIEVDGGPEFVDPPKSAPARSRLAVAWTVPAAEGDRVAIVPRGWESLDRYPATAVAPGARRAELPVPPAPGDYDLVYLTAEGRMEFDDVVMSGRVPLTVEP